MLSAPDNSCLLHLQEGRQKVRDRERESRRDPYTHKQMHSNTLLHIFPIKVVGSVIHKLRNAYGKKQITESNM